MTIYLIAGSVVSLLIAIGGAFLWGGRSMKHKRDAQDATRHAETYRKSQEAQDETSDLSDRALSDWLRERSKR